MQIRKLVPDDAADFLRVRVRGLREEPESFMSAPDSIENTPLEEIRQRMAANEKESITLIGAFDGGELMGLAGIRQHLNSPKVRHKSTIFGVYVVPEVRGQGVARAMMLYLIEVARAHPEIEQIIIEYTSNNVGARTLYEKLGFEWYGTQPRALKFPDGRYLDEDARILYLNK
jgi:ribosomal protein S18 acetylase RimI-like enzyme